MTHDKPILCLGIAVADLIGGPLTDIPRRADLVLADRMGLYPGGCAVNTATVLAHLGLPATIIAKVGDDPLGDFMVRTLVERHVEVGEIKRDPEAGTSASMVMVDPDGERRFFHYIGANACLSAEDVDLELVGSAAILHLAGFFLMPGLDGESAAALLRYARGAGVITTLDTAWDAQGSWMDLIAPCLPFIDYLVPNLIEARAISGLENPAEVACFLLDQGVGTVAIKMGAAGCLVMSDDRVPHRFPAYQVQVVDATGAGDAFAAGFIAGAYFDWPLDQTARLACAVGALCVTGMGALGGISSLPETLEFMNRTPVIGQD